MKVFISYSHNDKTFVQQLVQNLKKNQIEVLIDIFDFKVGDNIIKRIEDAILESDYSIIVLSKSFVQSKWALYELNAFLMREISNDRKTMLPILIEDCEIPILLRDRVYLDFRNEYDKPLKELIRSIKRRPPVKRRRQPPKKVLDEQTNALLKFQINKIKEQFKKGELTLFLGAGVSMNAGVPCWDDLLNFLLSNLFLSKFENIESGLENKLAKLYQDQFNTSPLMIAQYLKNGLGNGFLEYVRKGLYKYKDKPSKLINIITELCRPQRSRESLNSIITFNFDDLIEQSLVTNHIKHKSIFKEGERHLRSEIPIYHVHGYLPREGSLTKENEIVFSEDAYHSQFIDSFSWSNLVQLNHLNQNVCVFIGLSITDPNLRRLLDVSMRKNPNRNANHYVFKKRYNYKEINKQMIALGITDDSEQNTQNFIKIIESLEEQDSNNLGLNVIWLEEYSEVPEILSKLLEE